MESRKRDPEQNAVAIPVVPSAEHSDPRGKGDGSSRLDPRREMAQKAAKDRWAQWATKKAL
jgi:hypothetical protein